MTRRLSSVRRIYDAYPAGYRSGMALLSQRLLKARTESGGDGARTAPRRRLWNRAERL